MGHKKIERRRWRESLRDLFNTILPPLPPTRPPVDLAQLEDRILFSASPVAVLPAVEMPAAEMTVESFVLEEVPSNDRFIFTSPQQEPHMSDSARTTEQEALERQLIPDDTVVAHEQPLEQIRRELVFVDTGVNGSDQFLADLLARDDAQANMEVYLIDGHEDGLDRISEVLAGTSDVDAIHLVSHGSHGQVKLGDVWLNIDRLESYAGQIAGWQDSLRSGGDMLIYGCDLASTESGRALTEALGELTGADVAASVDDTGNARYGGNWELEFVAGTVASEIAFSDDLMQTWDGLLATVTVTQTSDVVNGNTSSIAALIGADGGDGISFREAILAANNTPNGGTADEIHFNFTDTDPGHLYYQDDLAMGSLSSVAVTNVSDASIVDFDPDYPYQQHSWFRIDLNPAAARLDITEEVIIDGYTQSGASANTLAVGHDAVLRVELTSTGADGDRGLTVMAGGAGSTIRALAINGFDISGIMIEPGADGVTVQENFLGTDITGSIDLENGDAGVHVRSGNNLIGGSANEHRNVISGNNGRGVATYTFGPIEAGNVIENNYIGVDATGVKNLGNISAGIQVFNNDSLQIRDNVIAGNTGDGIWLRNSATIANTVITGNLIGVGADGTTGIGNQGNGIYVEEAATNTTIGGILAGQANTIAHSGADGVYVKDGIGTSIRDIAIFGNAEDGD
jgi:hypothetical protein